MNFEMITTGLLPDQPLPRMQGADSWFKGFKFSQSSEESFASKGLDLDEVLQRKTIPYALHRERTP